ncbi:hypothetical protein KUW17_12980 [Leisingera aquaemixtae]|uniref:hypothetical protein n=1 Tax=Leisingera aquaemixtae TaxID=1396826 RepID=UPI001C954EC1|nr:hypothetical protein [Leisingera aquaemixtae]MBY6067664.1 hypothetical protein [Leisingera aquaemixtae]
MGRAKALMMEMEEAKWEETDASFYCPDCEKNVDGLVELPVVYEDGGEEHLPVSVLCFSCNQSFEGWAKTDWYSCEIELDDYPGLQVEASPVQGSIHDYDDYDDYDQDYFAWLEQQERLSRPVFHAFCKTNDDIRALALGIQADQRSRMLARMLLAQSITALEVFLADTLILTVTNNRDVQSRLLKSKELQIGSTEFRLSDAIGFEDFAKEKLLQYLRAVSFHNLKKVTGLFRVGLGIDISPESSELEQIQKAIKMRHDCVHRNGMDRETGEVHEISQAFLLGLTETLLRMVKAVDEKVEDFESPF